MHRIGLVLVYACIELGTALSALKWQLKQLVLTRFIRPCLENWAMKWQSVTVNGNHTHVVHSIRIKLCYLSRRNIWRKNFPDRDAAVAALWNHNKKAYATVKPMVDIHPPQLQTIGSFVFKYNIPTSKRGCWKKIHTATKSLSYLLFVYFQPLLVILNSDND